MEKSGAGWFSMVTSRIVEAPKPNSLVYCNDIEYVAAGHDEQSIGAVSLRTCQGTPVRDTTPKASYCSPTSSEKKRRILHSSPVNIVSAACNSSPNVGGESAVVKSNVPKSTSSVITSNP